eukprot:629617-Rhodomonas_salina.3
MLGTGRMLRSCIVLVALLSLALLPAGMGQDEAPAAAGGEAPAAGGAAAGGAGADASGDAAEDYKVRSQDCMMAACHFDSVLCCCVDVRHWVPSLGCREVLVGFTLWLEASHELRARSSLHALFFCSRVLTAMSPT